MEKYSNKKFVPEDILYFEFKDEDSFNPMSLKFSTKEWKVVNKKIVVPSGNIRLQNSELQLT